MNNQINSGALQGVPFSVAVAKMRIALVVLAFGSVIFPAVTVTTMGVFSQGVSLPTLAGSTAYLIPLGFALALAAPFVEHLQRYSRLIDVAATAVVALFVLWGLWSLFDFHSTMAQQDRALSSLIGGTPGFPAPRASSFGSITPSIGSFMLLATAALSGLQVRKMVRKPA